MSATGLKTLKADNKTALTSADTSIPICRMHIRQLSGHELQRGKDVPGGFCPAFIANHQPAYLAVLQAEGAGILRLGCLILAIWPCLATGQTIAHYFRQTCQPPGQKSIDPLRETNARIDGIKARNRSSKGIIISRGRDPEEIVREIAEKPFANHTSFIWKKW